MEIVVNSRIKSDAVSGINHLGEAKDVGDVIRIVINYAEAWDLCFEVQCASASVGVQSDGLLGGLNVANKIWVADGAVNARMGV